jgi:hypothetical protein
MLLSHKIGDEIDLTTHEKKPPWWASSEPWHLEVHIYMRGKYMLGYSR